MSFFVSHFACNRATPPTLTNLLRAALLLRKAKSTASSSMSVRFVASGSRVRRTVKSCVGPAAVGASLPVEGDGGWTGD